MRRFVEDDGARLARNLPQESLPTFLVRQETKEDEGGGRQSGNRECRGERRGAGYRLDTHILAKALAHNRDELGARVRDARRARVGRERHMLPIRQEGEDARARRAPRARRGGDGGGLFFLSTRG